MADRSSRRRRGTDSVARPRPGRWLALAGTIAAVLIGVVAIGLNTPEAAGPGEAATAASPTATEAPTAPLASAVAIADGTFPIVAYRGADVLGAEELDFGELLGMGTPVVLNFWAGQCPPCRAEMPAFQAVYDRHADEFLLVGVDIGPFIGLGSRESAIALLDDLDISYPTAYALDARAVQDNQVLGMPTTIFYDGAGEVVSRHTGLLTEQSFEARVLEAIGGSS